MAIDPEGRELKLYSQFQTEQAKQNTFERDNWSSYFGPSNSFPGFGSSAFNSPVESELGSYEIESDKDNDGGADDDYTAELTRRMAQYMLQDDDNSSTTSFRSEIQSKPWGLSGSPISTLWSPVGSSHGSPEGPSKEPSPPTTPMVAERGGLDISHNVFIKLEKMEVSTDGNKSIQTGLENGETGSSSSASSSSSLSSSKDQARALKNQKRKQNQQPFMKQRGSAAKQGQANSGTKPGGSGSKTGSSGTGVFLPRHVNYNRPGPSPPPPQPQPPKKKGCSTVLIPVRVLQALQLHYDRMDDETRQKITGFTALREAAAGARNATHAVEKRHPGAAATSQIDVSLPKEWTY